MSGHHVGAQQTLGVPVVYQAIDTSIVPSEGRTTWAPGVPGGVPSRTTICRTVNAASYGNGLQDATKAIQAAIDACPLGQVVLLSAGTFTLNNLVQINKGITLRGAGAGATRLQKTNGAVPFSYIAQDNCKHHFRPQIQLGNGGFRGEFASILSPPKDLPTLRH